MCLKMDSNATLAIIIPVKDHEPSLAGVVDGLLREHSPAELVFVVDGQSRETVNLARQYGIKVLYGAGRGKGFAMRLAIQSLRCDILVFIDADGSHDPADVRKLVAPIQSGAYDMIVGSRIKGGSDEFSGSIENAMHYWGNIISVWIVNVLWAKNDQRLTDCQNGFRAIRADVARMIQLREDGFAIEQEMVIECMRQNRRVGEVPVFEKQRRYGNTHINPFVMIARCTWCIIRHLIV